MGRDVKDVTKDPSAVLDKYEALYQRMAVPTSRRAADALFAASGEQLRQTYRPDKTEKTGQLR
jgi:hypothetical protein